MRSSTGRAKTLWVPNRQSREHRNRPNNQTNKQNPYAEELSRPICSGTQSHMLQNRTVSPDHLGELGLYWWQQSIIQRALLVPETQVGGVGYTGRMWGVTFCFEALQGLFPFCFAYLDRILVLCWFQTPKISRIFLTSFINRSS